MYSKRAPAGARAQPVADELVIEQQRTAGAALVGRPFAVREEWAMCDTDRREIEDRAEMDGYAGAARVVAAARVDEEHVRDLAQRPDSRLEQPAFAERQQSWLIRRTRVSAD
jgi:hypothetical protein